MTIKSIAKTSDLKIKNSLRRWFHESSVAQRNAGFDWYKSAQLFVRTIAAKYDLSSYKVAGVVSALSPNNKWFQNKKDAVTVIEAFIAGNDATSVKVCTYHANKYRAFDILAGDRVDGHGHKTHSFAMNVGLLSPSHITIDKWHIRACLAHLDTDPSSDIQQSIAPNQYRRVEAITAELALELGLKGYELQAIIWITIREAWGKLR